MLKYFLLTLLIVCTVYSYSATTSSFKVFQSDPVFINLAGTHISFNLVEYMRLKPSDFTKLAGHKLTWMETIAFKITQRRIKKVIRKDASNDMSAYIKHEKKSFRWHWGGFFLGLLLPVLGLIITAFFKDAQRKNRIDSAAIGTCVFGIIFLVILLRSL